MTSWRCVQTEKQGAGRELFSRQSDRRVNVEVRQFVAAAKIHNMLVHPSMRFGTVMIAQRLQNFFMRENKAFASIKPGKHLKKSWIEQLADGGAS